MRFDVITIFPKIFDSYLGESILRRAQEKKIVEVAMHNLRDFTRDKHKKVDDKPYGGGAGMVLQAMPILRAVERMRIKKQELRSKKTRVIVLSAKGRQFNQKMAYDFARKSGRLILNSGRYEGIDERAVKALGAEEISIGPYVLTDGDIAAMAIISAVSRLIPGVIKLESLAEESHWNLLLKKEARDAAGKGLEYPHYTRPEVLEYKGRTYRVPKVILSGDHKKIAEWRKKHAR